VKETESWNTGISSAEQTRASQESPVINELVFEALREKRRTRRWSIVLRLLGLGLFALLLFGLFGHKLPGFVGSSSRHTAVIDVQGIIAEGEVASASAIVAGLERALADRNTAGVILRINSPGGSPVQSGIVFDEIIRLRNQNPSIPIHAVVSDIGASGAYYLAAAADNIYADKASIVGSIGVRLDSFGLEGAMKALGIERRILVAGENKAMLDPFLAQNPEQIAHMQTLLDEIHNQFIAAVKRGRGDRLRDDPDIFSGLFWSGAQSLEMGLIDKLANVKHVAREVIGAAKLVNFTQQPDLVDRLARRFGASVSQRIRSWYLQLH